MKTTIHFIYTFLILISLTSCGYSQHEVDEKDDRITQLESEIECLEEQINSLKEENEAKSSTIDASSDEINDIIRKISFSYYSRSEEIATDLKNVSVMNI